MKKIINGKMYNTETATCLGDWDNGYSYRDFAYCEESLFVKRTGEYFLHGVGGAFTKYSSLDGDSQCGGEKIVPLTVNEAKQWVEEHLSADTYENIFGPVAE